MSVASVVDDFDSFSRNLFQIISEINDTSSFDYDDWFNKRVKSILGTLSMIVDNPSAGLPTTKSLSPTFKSAFVIFSYSSSLYCFWNRSQDYLPGLCLWRKALISHSL